MKLIKLELQTSLDLSTVATLKKELEFWGDDLKKQVFYQMNQMGKEIKNKVANLEEKLIELDKELMFISGRQVEIVPRNN